MTQTPKLHEHIQVESIEFSLIEHDRGRAHVDLLKTIPIALYGISEDIKNVFYKAFNALEFIVGYHGGQEDPMSMEQFREYVESAGHANVALNSISIFEGRTQDGDYSLLFHLTTPKDSFIQFGTKEITPEHLVPFCNAEYLEEKLIIK